MNKICVYAICKNELRFVEQWYNSVKEADYVVVLDTGSTDGTFEKLKELGFKDVKIARDLVYKVDTDSTRYSAIQDIVNNAKEVGIDITVVGVENSAQFTMLKDLDIDMKMQGYHFYKPLDDYHLIEEIRKNH